MMHPSQRAADDPDRIQSRQGTMQPVQRAADDPDRIQSRQGSMQIKVLRMTQTGFRAAKKD